MAVFKKQPDLRTVKPRLKTPIINEVKVYGLPLIEKMAYLYPLTKGVFLSLLVTAIATPIIIRFNQVWWTWLALSPILIIGVLCVINVIRWMYYRNKYLAWEYEQGKTPNHFDINEGAPGTCKTLHACFAIHAMAKWSWRELQYEYWQILPKIARGELLNEGDVEVKEAYEFYATHEGVPCCGSNIPLYSKEFRRFAYDINVDHLKMKERLPYRLNGLYDELSTICPTELHLDRTKNKNGSADISDMGKFCRQFGEFRFSACEQDGQNYFIDLRRVNSEVRSFKGKTEVLEPKFLRWLFEKLKNRAIDKMSLQQSMRFAAFLTKFDRFIKCCGFFKIKYVCVKKESQSVNDKQVVVTVREDQAEKGCLFFPRAMPFKYDTRAFRNGYKPLHDPILLKPYTKLKMSREKAIGALKSSNLVSVEK